MNENAIKLLLSWAAIGLLLLGLILLSCCSGCGTPKPQKGGTSRLSSPTTTIDVQQPENPQTATTQNTATESETITRIPLSTFSRMMELQPTNGTALPDHLREAVRVLALHTTNGVIEVVNRSKTTHEVALGSSWKDTARETAAKLKALGWLPFLGAALVIFGAASAFWPPLKLIVGSTTTSAACVVVGIALIALPSLIVGHELLILGVGVGGVALYWFSHRHGSVAKEAKVLRELFIDKNKDGIDDRLQQPRQPPGTQ